jgi:hypothetical protein
MLQRGKKKGKDRFIKEWFLAFRVFWASLLIAFGLHFLDIRFLVHVLERKKRLTQTESLTAFDIGKIVNAALRYSLFITPSKCLERSLLLFHILLIYGHPATIHFGARQLPSGLTGHCWITLHGKLLLDREEKVKEYTEVWVR